MKLDGKVAVVTGSSRGIGKAIALGFVKEDANVVIAGYTERQRKTIFPWVAFRHDPVVLEKFRGVLSKYGSRKKAIVAVTRKPACVLQILSVAVVFYAPPC